MATKLTQYVVTHKPKGRYIDFMRAGFCVVTATSKKQAIRESLFDAADRRYSKPKAQAVVEGQRRYI